ncbi:unnamed protein product [Ilex paraguariensis]|uniref:Uncharacterized protein n=1 Tax=Ilex paraguariensis TaxID=185542 RepID=A0ABC8TRJ5_9AQUA
MTILTLQSEFGGDLSLSFSGRLRIPFAVYKILQHVESYQKENKLNPLPIILCIDLNGSKQGHVYKFLRSQGFVSSYDTAHQYTDADAHKWVSHPNQGNTCGVDFIWLLNPDGYRKLLKTSWNEAVFSMYKDGEELRNANPCQKENKLNPLPIILSIDLNGSKRGHVYKFLRSQGFVSSYDTAHQYTDADAHKWVCHPNHQGNTCGVDFIWLLNPDGYRKLLKISWNEAVFSMYKDGEELRNANPCQKENKLNPLPIILCIDLNGSKRGHVYKFLRSQGFVSSYDTAHQYTDADAHKWVSHPNHRGNTCGVDFIWLLNPDGYRKLLKTSWNEAVFSMYKVVRGRVDIVKCWQIDSNGFILVVVLEVTVLMVTPRGCW